MQLVCVCVCVCVCMCVRACVRVCDACKLELLCTMRERENFHFFLSENKKHCSWCFNYLQFDTCSQPFPVCLASAHLPVLAFCSYTHIWTHTHTHTECMHACTHSDMDTHTHSHTQIACMHVHAQKHRSYIMTHANRSVHVLDKHFINFTRPSHPKLVIHTRAHKHTHTHIHTHSLTHSHCHTHKH